MDNSAQVGFCLHLKAVQTNLRVFFARAFDEILQEFPCCGCLSAFLGSDSDPASIFHQCCSCFYLFDFFDCLSKEVCSLYYKFCCRPWIRGRFRVLFLEKKWKLNMGHVGHGEGNNHSSWPRNQRHSIPSRGNHNGILAQHTNSSTWEQFKELFNSSRGYLEIRSVVLHVFLSWLFTAFILFCLAGFHAALWSPDDF